MTGTCLEVLRQVLLGPRSVAVVGASSDPFKTSGRPTLFLKQHGFDGDIWPINPNRSAEDVVARATINSALLALDTTWSAVVRIATLPEDLADRMRPWNIGAGATICAESRHARRRAHLPVTSLLDTGQGIVVDQPPVRLSAHTSV